MHAQNKKKITTGLYCMRCIISSELCAPCQYCKLVYAPPHLAILTRLTGTQVLATVDTLTENKQSVNIIVLRQIGLLNLRND